MQKHRHSDELLWHNIHRYPDELLWRWRSMPDDADVVRAFFSEDRSRRILVYRNMTEIAQTK